MIVTKSEVKRASKKLLSVLLAVVMLMSTMSVCFGTIGFAANDTGAIDAFVAAAKCDALKNGNFTVTQNGRTYTFTAKSYAHYVQLDNVIDKLDAAIKGLDEYKNNAHHNNNKNCADAWYGGDNCTDLGWVEKYLKLAIGDSELATLNGTYNLEKLFAAVFNMTDMNYRNADTKETDDKDDTESAGNVPDEVTNTLIVTTSKVHDKLLEYSSISAIPNNFALTTTYTLKMFEQNYTTTKTSGCDEVTVNHYHIAMNINKTGGVPSIAVSNGDSQKAVLTSAESVFNSYADYINAADVVGILELSEDEDALAIVKDALVTAKDSVINTHSEDVYNHFFDEVKIAAAIKNIDDAIKFLGFAPTVEELIRLNAVDYSSYTESQLLEHLTAFEKKIAEYDALEAATQNLIIEVYDLDIAAIKATCADVRHDYEVYGIVRLKAQTDTHMAMYAGWNEAMIDEGTVTKAMLTTAVATIANDISQFGNYVQANVVEVCGETYLTTLGEFKVELERLGKIAGLNEAFLYEYAKFRDEIKNAIAEDSETLLESLINYDSWVTDLKALIATMETELGKELANQLFDELNEPMMAYIGNAYTVLRIRTEDEINTAYDLFSAYKKTYGETIVMATVSEYKAFADAIGRINVATYDFLVASPNVEITQDIINKYNELMGVDYGYADFLATYGFSTFQTSTVADIVRKDSADDIARENADTDKDGIGEYVTKDSEIESVIAKIDAALSNAAVKDALGLDLSTMLSDLVSNAIISDSFINTVVDMLYPLVLKEFAKVFENELPQKVTDPITADVNYKMNIHGVLQNTGFEVYPDLLAAVLDKNLYADNIAMLNAAYKNFDKEFGASTGGLSYTTMLDPEGGVKADGTTPRTILDKTAWDSVEIRDENGKLKLTWGVDAAKEAGMAGDELKNFFYDRFDDAVEGLKPLLLALIANKPWNPGEIAEFATASIATVSLKLGATASSGYANLIVPIFEALGISYTNVSVIETEHITKTNDVAAIIKEILGPIFGFVEQIGNAPLNTVLGILPNLCYALSTNMVTPLLSMLKTSITYAATPKAACISLDPITGGADVDVGEMLNINDLIDLSDGLNSILAQFGIKLPTINQGYVATLGKLEKINSQRKQAIYPIEAGKGYSVKANKADVLAFLVDYILDVVKKKADFEALLGALITKDVPDLDENGAEQYDKDGNLITKKVADEEKIAGVTDVVYGTLKLNELNNDAAIAAVVELLNAKKYDTLENYEWYHGYIDDAAVGTLTDPAVQVYMDTNNDWTEAKAEYLYENIDAIVGAILKMANVDLDKETEGVQADLGKFIGGVFTADTLTSLARLLGSLSDIGALLAPKTEEDASAPETVAEGEDATEGEEEAEAEGIDINALLKGLLGIDLGAFEAYAAIPSEEDPDYVYDFGTEITDVESFAAVLADMLKPISPLLDFILEGKNLVINLSATQKIELIGYSGYDNAIAPILEALGCDVEALGENDALALTLAALAGKIDAIVNNGTVKGIIDILPGLFYFLAGNNLSTAVRNLLQPVYVILDTIRPIYNVDLAELLAGIEIKGEPLGLDLDVLNLNFVIDLVKKLLPADIDLGTLLDDVKQLIYSICKLVGTEYTSVSTLEDQTWKRGQYGDFSQADLITVLLSYVLDWATVPANGAKLDALLGTDGIIENINKVFADIKIEYKTPTWNYFATDAAWADYIENGTALPNTLAALEYPNNWTEAAAQYVADNLAEIVDDVVAMVTKGESETVAALLTDLINGNLGEYFTADMINELIGYISGVLVNVDDVLLEVGYEILGVDLVALKNYNCTAEVNDLASFVAELARILDSYAKPLVDLLFFGDDIRLASKAADGKDQIVINGGEGYEKGLAIILEALGCDVPAVEDATTATVLKSLTDRIDEILVAPVDEVVELLPNLIYVLNANALGVAVGNLLQPVYAILDKINGLGVLENPIVIADLLKFEKDGEEVAIDIENLAISNVVEIIETFAGLDLTTIENILNGFYVGKITETKFGYRMDAPAKDVITILVTAVLIFVEDEANEEDLKALIGEDIYSAILSVLNIEANPVQDMNWLYTDKVGQEFSPVNGSADAEFAYGKNYTKVEAQYIADHFGTFVNNIINLLGIQINGDYVNGLSELLGGLVGGLYNSDNVIAIRDALAGILDGITALEVNGMVVGGHISEVLKVSLGLDLAAVGATEVPAFENDKAAFISALAEVLDPLGPILNWLLTNKEIAFFTDLNGEDIVVLPGAEGYKNGIVLLLEALGCENIVDPADLDVNASGADIVTAIIEPLLNKIDVILADPANEIFAILPNLVYFINSNGVDTVVKNTLNAVFTVLNAIEPIAKIDLYALIGLDLATLDFNKLYDMLIENLNVAGFSFEGVEIDAVGDLTIGTLESYDSLSGKTAYRMVYAGKSAQADMVTAILTLLIKFVTTENNQAAVVALLESIGMTAEGKKYVAAFIEFLATCVADTSLGMDAALYAIYYVYYGVDMGASELVTGKEQLNNQWKETLAELNKDASSEETKVGDLLTDIFDIMFNDKGEDGKYPEGNDVLDQNGVASNGFLSFFARIKAFFQEIADFFRNLFSFGK